MIHPPGAAVDRLGLCYSSSETRDYKLIVCGGDVIGAGHKRVSAQLKRRVAASSDEHREPESARIYHQREWERKREKLPIAAAAHQPLLGPVPVCVGYCTAISFSQVQRQINNCRHGTLLLGASRAQTSAVPSSSSSSHACNSRHRVEVHMLQEHVDTQNTTRCVFFFVLQGIACAHS